MRFFLAAVEMKPLTLWACQSVAFIISASVAPFARPIISRIFAPLLSARGVLASLRAGFAAELGRSVNSMEIIEPLAREARQRLQRLAYENVAVRCGDGFKGWKESGGPVAEKE